MRLLTRAAGAAIVGLALASCAPAHVRTIGSAATPPLPPPAHVVVYDFALSPGSVRLDEGVRARLQRARSGEPLTAEEQATAEAAQATLADVLSRKLAAYGLPVERLPEGAEPPPDSLLVQGRIASVNEGNRTRRVMVGFGAGKSSFTADADLYSTAEPGPPRLVETMEGDSNSGHMPGAVGTMGAGAVAGRIATSAALTGATHAHAERHRTSTEADAARLADALARKIGAFAVAEEWIPATAMH